MEVKVLSQNGCNPCQMVKNYLTNEEIEFEEINVSYDKSAIEKYRILSTPVTILVDDNEEVARVSGFKPDDLEAIINQL